MMKKNISLIAVLIFSATQSFAGSGVASNNSSYAPNNTTQVPTANGQKQYNINEGALHQSSAASGDQSNGMIMGLAAAGISSGLVGKFMPTCVGKPYSTCPQMQMAIAGIQIAMSVFGQMQSARDASNRTAGAVSLNGQITNARYTDNPAYQEVVKVKNDLAKHGYILNDDGSFSTPDGKKYSPSDYSSAESMAAIGMSPSDIKAFGNMMGDIMSKAKSKASAADKSESGSADITVTSGGGSSTGYADVATNVGPKIGIDRNPAQVAGLSKKLNGEPIGVAADSLFGMMNRRYEVVAKSCQVLVNKNCESGAP